MDTVTGVRVEVSPGDLSGAVFPQAQGVGGLQALSTALFTRPNDTTTYAAQDTVSNSTSAPTVLTFANASRIAAGSGAILSARHEKSSTTTTNATFRLHLFTAAPTAINDNSPFTYLFASRATRVGFIDFTHGAAGTGSDGTQALSTFVSLPFVCAAASTSLFGLLTATAAYAPAAQEQHFIELHLLQN